MTDRPIIFSGPMVRALLDGRKTQTRRVLNPQPPEWVNELVQPYRYPRTEVDRYGEEYPGKEIFGASTPDGDWGVEIRFEPGDRLWVREAIDKVSGPDEVFYRADYDAEYPEGSNGLGWRPSIHMPRWASRLTLIVTHVRVQRLHEIGEKDAIAEGCGWRDTGRPADNDLLVGDPVPAFSNLWQAIHGPDAWAANPWVAAVSFTTHRCNIDAMEARP
jgi:hypothetical protein